MRRALNEQFNREVEAYRRALLYYARVCKWDEFEARAGILFDYIESVEFSELERRFFGVFTSILVLLSAAVIMLLGVDFSVHTEWLRLKDALVLSSLAGSGFDLYFYLNYRWYLSARVQYARQRREAFIRNLEQDFRVYAQQS